MESVLLIRIQLYGKKKCAYNIVMFCVMSFVRCSVLSSCSVCFIFFFSYTFNSFNVFLFFLVENVSILEKSITFLLLLLFF